MCFLVVTAWRVLTTPGAPYETMVVCGRTRTCNLRALYPVELYADKNQNAGLSPPVALSTPRSPYLEHRSSRLSGRRSRRMVSNDEHGRFTLHRKVAVSRRWGVYDLLNVHAYPTCLGSTSCTRFLARCARGAALVRAWPELQSTRHLTSRGEGGTRTRIEAPFTIASVIGMLNSRHNPVGCLPYFSPEESNLRGPHTAIVLPHQSRRPGVEPGSNGAC